MKYYKHVQTSITHMQRTPHNQQPTTILVLYFPETSAGAGPRARGPAVPAGPEPQRVQSY